MLWLAVPSAVAISASALLAAGCAKGRDDAKRPKSSGSNRASNKQRQSGKSSRKAGSSGKARASSKSRSSRRDPKAAGAAGAKKSSRSKREGGSSKSGRSKKSAKPLTADPNKKATPAAGAVATDVKLDKSGKSAGKSSSSKRRSSKDKLKKDKSVEGSQRSSRGGKSSKRSSRSKRSSSKSKSKRSSKSKKAPATKELQVDKTQEISGEELPKSKDPKDAALKTAISPMAVSVTKLELAPVEGVAKHEIRIEPSELRWKSTGGIQNVAVYNHSNVRKALKIKCSDNLLYRVNPVHAFIPAGGSVRVDILRQNGTAKVDKIVIVAADAGQADGNAREVLTRSTNTDMMVLPLIATAAN